MKTNGKPEKIIIISYIVITVFLLLIMRLWQLQILQGNEFRKLSEANRLRIVSIPAPRGIIFDRNGIPLVKDIPIIMQPLSRMSSIKAESTLCQKSSRYPSKKYLRR